MADKILAINLFNGGIASGSKRGLQGAFRFASGCDIHLDPDVLQINPASTKDSGSTITDLIRFISANTVNSNIYFGGDSGKLYKRTSAGSWSVVKTFSSGITGLAFFSGTNLIYGSAGNTQFTLNPSTDAIVESYRTLNSADFHPSEVFLDKIFTGNGRELVSVDASAIQYDSATVGGGVTIEYNQKIRCIRNIGDWLLIGAVADNSSLAKYYIWDGTSADVNFAYTLKGEDGINSAEVGDDGTVLVSAGKQGHLYQLINLDTNLKRIKTIPYIEKDKTIETYPEATTNYQGNVLFGLSAGTSLTAERGIYSWASTDKNYPHTLNMDFIISTETTTGTTLQIGCLFAANTNNLFIGWRDGSSYGIDLISGAGVQSVASYSTLIHDDGVPLQTKYYKNIQVKLAGDLATTEIINLYYKADRASTWTQVVNGTDTNSIDFSVDGAINYKSFKPNFRAKEAEFRLTFNHTSTTAPKIDAIIVEFSDENYE